MRFNASALVSLPMIDPRRRPTQTVAVMSRSSERPLVVIRLSANRACDSAALVSDTTASSAPAALAWASAVSQMASASSRVNISTAAVFRTVTLRKRAGGQPWLTALVWPGSPLPSAEVPHSL